MKDWIKSFVATLVLPILLMGCTPSAETTEEPCIRVWQIVLAGLVFLAIAMRCEGKNNFKLGEG